MMTLDQVLDYLTLERSYVASQLDCATVVSAEYWGGRLIEIATIQHAILQTPDAELAEAIVMCQYIVASKG